MKIAKEQKNRIKKIAEKYNLKLVLVFGSYVNGNTHPQSDLDIAVLSEKDFDFSKHCSLVCDFEKIFSGRNIDLVLLNRANPLLLKKILENCQIIHGKKKILESLKLYSFHRYCDYQKYFDLERKFVNQFIRKI